MRGDSIVLALHGGAGTDPTRDYREQVAHMRSLVELGRSRLLEGAAAIDVVTEIVAALESSGLYIAGRGASPNTTGEYELDACLMNGATGKAGAVAALQGFSNPIMAARGVMDLTPHVMLVGQGAGHFAGSLRLSVVTDPTRWFTQAGAFEFNHLPAEAAPGTVGCVVKDALGHLAAATSTAGVFGKLPGRVSDSAQVGAGTWADADVAVSCTGQGEFFIRSAAAVQVAHRMKFGGATLETATDATLADISRRGGSGGLIAIDRSGNVAMPFVSTGMKRAALLADGSIVSLAP